MDSDEEHQSNPEDYIPKEGDTMQDNEGTWFFEDGQWWLI